jgi:ATP-dependent Lon protease
VVNDKEESILITPDNLGDYVGKPVFSSDKMYDQTPVSAV